MNETLLFMKISDLQEENDELIRKNQRALECLEATAALIRSLVCKEEDAESNALEWLAGYEEIIDERED